MNAFFAYSVVLDMGLTWQEGLSAVFLSSILFLILAFTGVRKKMIQAIPHEIKQAGTVGLGIFIAFVSFKNSGIIVADEGLLISFGGFADPNVQIALFGFLVAAFFLVRGNQFAVFYGMIGAALFGLGLRFGANHGYLHYDDVVMASLPQLPEGSLLAFPTQAIKTMFSTTFLVSVRNVPKMLNMKAMVVVFTFLFLDFFGTATTLSAAASQVPNKGDDPLEENSRIYVADAFGSFVGSLFGTSNLSTYIESVAGIISGARTGLMAVVAAIFFLLSLFLHPLLSVVTSAVTTPALMVVGIFMMKNIETIDWSAGFEVVIPSFMIIVMMPLTGSISLGLTLGFITWEILMIFAGRVQEIPKMMHVITIISFLYLLTL